MWEENRIDFHQRYLPFIRSHKEIYIKVDDHPQVPIIGQIKVDDHPQVPIIRQNLMFYNTLPWMIITVCFIKTLQGKTLVKEKQCNILFDYYNCLVKNLTSKTQWDKTWTKEKRVQLSFSPSCKRIMISSIFQMEDLSIFTFQFHTLTFQCGRR